MPILQFHIINRPQSYVVTFGNNQDFVDVEYSLDTYSTGPNNNQVHLSYRMYQNNSGIAFSNQKPVIIMPPVTLTSSSMNFINRVDFLCMNPVGCKNVKVTIEVTAMLNDGSKLITNFSVNFI